MIVSPCCFKDHAPQLPFGATVRGQGLHACVRTLVIGKLIDSNEARFRAHISVLIKLLCRTSELPFSHCHWNYIRKYDNDKCKLKLSYMYSWKF